MTTPILGITELADGQIDQFATANAAFRALEAAANDWTAVNVSAGDAAVSDADMKTYQVFSVSGHTANQAVTFGANKRVFQVYNASDTYTTNVTIGATVISVPAETLYKFWADGTTDGLVRAL
ncbi:hypothetical protein G8770_03505 [Aestuariicella hydrocarbonica]|uniref:Uncharacterized protein n=1 Tax=Pseudomaricurvus hydrocarbonicus TaxID=1470433 RepID=A0A9E5MGG1_9GAMM|nr:hypothetical protein [Aestuariicella hydrocarbonica]NHO64611.1 hypothetical protein [Aestuariicella hydrocarbonica]